MANMSVCACEREKQTEREREGGTFSGAIAQCYVYFWFFWSLVMCL